MRNPEEERKDAMLGSLEDLGLSEQQLELATKYVNGESKSCDLGIKTKQQITNPRDEQIFKVIERLERHKESEMEARYLEILYQIFGVNMVPAYNRAYSAIKYLPPRQRVALEATRTYRNRTYGYGTFKGILQITGDREILRAAMEDTDKIAGGPDFSILTAMFYDGPQNKPWDGKSIVRARQTTPEMNENKPAEKGLFGFLGGLLGLSSNVGSAAPAGLTPNGNSGFETNVYTQKYTAELKRLEEMFPEILDKIFYATIPGNVKQAMVDFLHEKDLTKPVPAEVLAFTANAAKSLLPKEGGYYISYAAVNYRLSPVLYQFLRICLSGDMQEKGLQYMYYTEFKQGMEPEVKRWRADFRLDDVTYITWLASKWVHQNSNLQMDKTISGRLLAFMTKENPDAYVQAIRQAKTENYQTLINAAKSSGNSAFIKEKLTPLIGTEKTEFQKKIAATLVSSQDPMLVADVNDFLFGAKGIEAVLPWEAKLDSGNSYQNVSGPVINYISVYGCDEFYNRCMAILGIRLLPYSIYPFCMDNRTFSTKYMTSMLDTMAAGGLPILQRLKVASMILDFWQGKREEKAKALEIYFAKELSEHREETIAAFRNAPACGRILGLGVYGKNPSENKAELLQYVGESSKQVREELVKICASQKDWMEDFLQILKTSKKSAERETAAMVLANDKKISEHREELTALAEQEKSKKVADLIWSILRSSGSGDQGAANGAEDLAQPLSLTPDAFVREMHKGGKKRGLAWIYDEPMPEVHFRVREMAAEPGAEGTTQGEAEQPEAAQSEATQSEAAAQPQTASEEYLQAILLAYSSITVPGVNKDVLVLTRDLNPSELANYVDVVYEKFMSQGAEAKKKWVLYCASIHGGSKMVPKLQHQINEWAENSRGAIAAEAVKAMALNDSPTALLLVDGMARKYKFKQVRKAAQDAMLFAASQLGLTVEELADRIVPDLGFDEKMERRFDYGTRSFTVRISPSLDIEVKDETGKKLKSLPAVGKNDDEAKATAALEEFKELKKQMKTTVKTQALRLELAMSLDRKWTAGNWKKLFVKNPLMHQFAISLIWGDYRDGKLETTFRYLEDGTFNTVDEEEYELSDEALIGLVHPIELDKETIDAWKEQLSDYEITQAVEQLQRPVFLATEEEKGKKSLDRFGGKILNGLSLSGKLTGLGWSKGMPEDAGIYYSFNRKDVEAGYGVMLSFSGAYAGDENDEVTVYDARIYKLEDFDKCCLGYSHVRDKEKKELALGQVSPRYLSEIFYQISKATASSTETDANWRNSK